MCWSWCSLEAPLQSGSWWKAWDAFLSAMQNDGGGGGVNHGVFRSGPKCTTINIITLLSFAEAFTLLPPPPTHPPTLNTLFGSWLIILTPVCCVPLCPHCPSYREGWRPRAGQGVAAQKVCGCAVGGPCGGHGPAVAGWWVTLGQECKSQPQGNLQNAVGINNKGLS